MKIAYESVERIAGVSPRSKEWIEYKGTLQVFAAGAAPVHLQLTFVPPHPFLCNMPETHSIRGKSLTEVYVKLVRFLRRHGFEFGH
mgnify:CR=1 FL=1